MYITNCMQTSDEDLIEKRELFPSKAEPRKKSTLVLNPVTFLSTQLRCTRCSQAINFIKTRLFSDFSKGYCPLWADNKGHAIFIEVKTVKMITSKFPKKPIRTRKPFRLSYLKFQRSSTYQDFALHELAKNIVLPNFISVPKLCTGQFGRYFLIIDSHKRRFRF